MCSSDLYEEGAMKPDAKIYEAVERKTGKSKDAILYIDDRIENVEAGLARGWQVIHQVSVQRTLQAAAELGFETEY